MMHILFSMPVHENNDIVRLTIANVQQHVRDCTIVIHASAGFKDFDHGIGRIPGVTINPLRFETKHGHSQFGIHLQNYAHATACGIPFTTFCILHTSEMFVRSGLDAHASKHPYSLWYDRNNMPRGTNWHPMHYALGSNVFGDLFPDPTWYLGSLIEGMWISREIMEMIYAYAARRSELMGAIPWTLEEVAFPSLTNWFGRGQPHGEPYNAFFDKATAEIGDVDRVVDGQLVELWATNCWNGSGTPILSDGATKFSVKRLARNLDDPVRQHIIRLTGLDIRAIIGQ